MKEEIVMKRKLKAQRLFEKYRHYSIPSNNSTSDYKEFHKAKDEFVFCMIHLALQGKLFIEQNDGITNKLRAVDPSQDSWLGRED